MISRSTDEKSGRTEPALTGPRTGEADASSSTALSRTVEQMWVPHSEEELKRAVAAGTVRETGTFDAKAAMPAQGKNKDLARDICAMTVDGGVLVYGLGGDDPTRPNALLPFDLAGAAERIDQVAQMAIAEPPTIEIHDIPVQDGSGVGYLAVEIPASPRAPHMVTLEGDNRYYGRGATGNRILTEGEVARLYSRRERWEIDRRAWLEDAVAGMPFAFEAPLERVGPMLVLARPVAASDRLLSRACGEQDPRHFLQRDVAEMARSRDPYPDQGTSGIGDALDVTRRGAEVWVMQRDRDLTSSYQSRLEIALDGTLSYWHAPVINSRAQREEGPAFIMERSITRALFQTLVVASLLYERGGYAGAVDVGVAVLGIEHATGAALSNSFDSGPIYGAAEYRHDLRATTTEIRRDPEGLTRHLLEGLFDVVSPRQYDPFAERRR